MPFLSSPIAYPSTSSPPIESPRKRRKIQEEDREPLRDVLSNGALKGRAGFVFDESDEDVDDVENASAKAEAEGNRQEASDMRTLKREASRRTTTDETEDAMDIDHSKAGPSPSQSQADSGVDIAHLGTSFLSRKTHTAKTCSGRTLTIRQRPKRTNTHYQQLAAARSNVDTSRAQKNFYGVDVHRLMSEAKAELEIQKESTAAQPDITPSTETPDASTSHTKPKQLWTEKYRAKKFTDLVGDERTHRSVLRWLKSWDPTVFPHATRPSTLKKKSALRQGADENNTQQHMRKVLLLTGPPGLGKTTLAHVCAKQAGYEVQEINASDERSRDVVKGRIRDMVCTENVKAVGTRAGGKATRPVCVVVDEVDGVVGGAGGGGSGGGEGGFVKALLDLLTLDQKNTKLLGAKKSFAETQMRKKRKGDNFRLLRPLILICNDLYHPSLRLLRQGNMAEVVYVRKPALNMVIPRMQSIFEREGIPCDSDGVRQLCEVTWGISNRREDRSSGGTGDGDIRGILVVAEWVASKLAAEQEQTPNPAQPLRLTKRWLEEHVLNDLAHGGGAARGLGRGGSKEVVERVFAYNAGFPLHAQTSKTLDDALSAVGSADAAKGRAMQRLHEMVQSSGEDDRIMSDCFTTFPTAPFHDDRLLTKPVAAYDHWLHLHDTLSSLIYSSAQEWELMPYLSTPVLAFHHLFSATSKHSAATWTSVTAPTANDSIDSISSAPEHPLTGPRAPTTAAELTRTNLAILKDLHATLSLPLHRAFRSPPDLATDLLPYLLRILNPDIKPVVVGGSGGGASSGSGSSAGTASVRRATEKARVARAVDAMIACGVRFERGRVEDVLPAGGAEAQDAVTTAAAPALTRGAASAGYVYRMHPPLDALGAYDTGGGAGRKVGGGGGGGGDAAGAGSVGGGVSVSTTGEKVRYAVRQVLEQEHAREVARREQEARVARVKSAVFEVAGGAGGALRQGEEDEREAELAAKMAAAEKRAVKRDFFGRAIVETSASAAASDSPDAREQAKPNGSVGSGKEKEEGRIWITYHEGFSNAVRKPITLKELMEGL